MEIKTCPFCGEKPEVVYDGYGWMVFCDGDSHYARAGLFMTEEQAVEEWNKRRMVTK
jgi:sarcosine oxidase delta subunit